MHSSDIWGNQVDQESNRILDEADSPSTNTTPTEDAATDTTTVLTPVLVTTPVLDDMNDRATCGTFHYGGDPATLGARWLTWSERWLLYVDAASLTDTKLKSTDLLLIGLEAYEIYTSLKKEDNSDTMDQIYAFMKAQVGIHRKLHLPTRTSATRRAGPRVRHATPPACRTLQFRYKSRVRNLEPVCRGLQNARISNQVLPH